MDQFLENRQNYMMDNNSIQQLNVASAGDGIGGGVQSEVVSGVAAEILGGKYDEHHEEHDVDDDDELKYVEEVQQSEKQQQQQLQTLKNIALDDDGTCESNELAEKETSNNDVHEFGNGNGGFVFGGDHQNREQRQHHDLFNIGNGHNTNGHDVLNVNENLGTLVSTGIEEKLNLMESELDGFKIEGDLSSTSNITEPADGIVHEIDVKIETNVENNEMVDEEEPSSLATNTTNGTSSLSENIPPQANIDCQSNDLDDLIIHLEDKENSDPLIQQRPTDLDLDQSQSQLNPDAKEFIPSFGSNPASPTSPFATGNLQAEPVLSEIMETQMYFGQAPTVVPRHLIEDDDLVAQSPCKGKDDNNMDSVLMPRALSEFELEADKRPHELEPEVTEGFIQGEEVMTPDQAIQQLPLDIEMLEKNSLATIDLTDFKSSNFMDHGPETSVDHETDLELQSSPQGENDDVMKRSMYITSDDAIEVVLNSVQPIPTEIDSINNSFIEDSITESAANQLTGDKELLQVEEKEHVSHSPSTEEMQMNLQNNLSCSNRDIPQLPADMQDILFMEQDQNILPENQQYANFTSENPFKVENMLIDQQQSVQDDRIEKQMLEKEPKQDNTTEFENKILLEEPLIKEKNCDEQHIDHLSEKPTQHLQDTTELFSPFKVTDDISNTNVYESVNNEMHGNLQASKVSNVPAFESFKESPANLQQPDFANIDMADEKHLLEQTKEQHLFSGFEQQMSKLLLNSTDGNLSQAEEVAATTATTAIEDLSDSLISTDVTIDKKEQFQQQPEPEQTLVEDSFWRHEQECLQQYQQEQKEIVVETETKADEIMHEEFQTEMADIEEPMTMAKQATTLLAHEQTEMKTEKNNELPICLVPVTALTDVLEPTLTAHSETEIEKQPEQQSEEVKIDIVKEPEATTVKDNVVTAPEIVSKVCAVAALGATAAAVTTTDKEVASSASTKKPLSKVTTASAKSKVASTTAAKKLVETAKKNVGLVGKPRTALAKPLAATIDKKTTTTTTTTLANRKPTTTSKVAAKTTTTTTTVRTLTAAPRTTTISKPTTTTSKPTATPRTLPSSNLTARKTTTTTSSLAKPRPASAPAKPTTLGLSATNGAPKTTKAVSPRSTVTSQVRKTASVTTAAKSPIKPTVAASTLASRTKTTTSTVSSTAGTACKTFTARPAPKFTSSASATTTTTASKRLTAPATTTTSSTATTLKAASFPLRKSTPTKTPTKSSPGGQKSKTPIAKTASPDVKPAPIRKPVDKTLAVDTNAEDNAAKKLNDLTEEQLMNSDMQAVQQKQNGDSSIPMQTEKVEQSFLETRDEQISNA